MLSRQERAQRLGDRPSPLGSLEPAGRLDRLGIARARDELSRLAPVDLATELLARLGGGESFDGSDELLIAERLAQSLGSSIDVHLNRFARRRHRDLLSPVVERLGLHALRGATVVDVGCGSLNPFSFSYLLLLLGAEKAYAIDAEPIQDVVLATKALATATAWLLLDPSEVLGVDAIGRAEVLRNARDFDLHLLAAGDPAGIAGSRLAHRIESIHRLSLETGEADAVFSVSLLEHLDRIDEALESLRRVTKPGGVGLHVVDFVDHRSYGDARVSPYAFLTETPGPALLHGCNRIRCREMCQLFERHGFAVENVERWSQHPPPTEAERARFAEPYRSMSYENIATDGARILVRRRGQFN